MMIAPFKQQNYSIAQITSIMQRSASTTSRELLRNGEQGTASAYAQQNGHQRRKQSRPTRKLHRQSNLFAMVPTLPCSRWSPEQVASTLARAVSNRVFAACVTKNHLHLHLRPPRGRVAYGTDCQLAPEPQQAHTAQQRPGQWWPCTFAIRIVRGKRQQREHQRPGAPVPAQRHRSVGLQPGATGRHRR